MKIHQLPEGARFEYEGEEYVKTGPLFATGKSGQRLIPKYAVLTPLGDIKRTTTPVAMASLPKEQVLLAFETFHAECMTLVPQDGHSALRAARERFLIAIG